MSGATTLNHIVCLADLVEHIRNGDFPEWDFQIQTMKSEEQEDFWFDPLDSTKVSSLLSFLCM